MSDFCTQCSIATFGDKIQPDINIREIASSLENGMYVPVLCEGCGMNAVGKDENGQIIVHVPKNVRDDADKQYNWIRLEDFEKDHLTKYWYHASERK
jgi:hypothetical protein